MKDLTNQKLRRVRRIYSFWGKFSHLYDAQDFVTFFGRPRIIRKKAVEALGLKKGDKVLEVACGSGRNFPYLAEAVGREGKIVGFDYSPEMLYAAKRLCRKNGWVNIKLIRGDAAQLKISEKDFDGVLSVLGVSAIPGWQKAIKRCKGILRAGGKLVICDARLFDRALRFLNPAIKLVYSKFAGWDPTKNIPHQMNETFGNVKFENFNFGAFFIAVSVKKASRRKSVQ